MLGTLTIPILLYMFLSTMGVADKLYDDGSGMEHTFSPPETLYEKVICQQGGEPGAS